MLVWVWGEAPCKPYTKSAGTYRIRKKGCPTLYFGKLSRAARVKILISDISNLNYFDIFVAYIYIYTHIHNSKNSLLAA